MDYFKNDVPFYCLVGKSGIVTIEYYPAIKYGGSGVTGRLESYDYEALKQCPNNMIVMDCRFASDSDIISFILKNDSPASLYQLAGNNDKLNELLSEYCQIAEKYGYRILTAENFLNNEKKEKITY